ncbi:MAG: pro-sigmaK processing inhibitor BofA family protein [Eubacteriales bacterium]
MSDNQILVIIIIACLIIMGIAIVVKKTHVIVSIILKGAFGLLSIYLTNEIIATVRLDLAVGLNLGTGLLTGILGWPGFILLYILAIYDFFTK